MKIIIFSYLFPNKKFPHYGIFNLSRAKSLQKLGHEVIVIAPVSINPHVNYLYPNFHPVKMLKLFAKFLAIDSYEYFEEIKVYHPKWLKLPDKYFWKNHSGILKFFINHKVERIIKLYRPEIIIGTWINPFGVYISSISKQLGITNFIIAEGSDILILPKIYKGWPTIEQKINKNCDLIISVSENMKTKISENTKLVNVNVIRNGYDSESFYLNEEEAKLRNKTLKIINVANFNKVKGQDILLKAIKLLNIEVEVTFVGDGPELTRCRKYVEENGIKDKVNFLGKISHQNIMPLLKQHDIFCLPSRSEGLPSAPLEAMACGLPVVGFDVGGMSEIIINDFNGFLCNPESLDDLAHKLIMASSKKWEYMQISKWVESNFSWMSWANNINLAYKSIIKTKIQIPLNEYVN